MDCLSEKKMPEELVDACILAQKESLPILTEDFLYLQINEYETKKKTPEYFSSLALIRSLYEKKLLNFKEYLDYFSYLSSYRFRFLPITPDDIEKAALGEGDIIIAHPENIKMLNFPLTFSERYGVSFKVAFKVVVISLLRIITDNTISIEIAERIFIEIINSFPIKVTKKEFGQLLLNTSIQILRMSKSVFLELPENRLINQKVERFFHATEIFNYERKY